MTFLVRNCHAAAGEIVSTVRCSTSRLSETMLNEKSARSPNNILASHLSAERARNDAIHNTSENPARLRPVHGAAEHANHSNRSPRSSEDTGQDAAITFLPPI